MGLRRRNDKLRLVIIVVVLIIISMGCIVWGGFMADAGTVKFTWQKNKEADLAGYKFHYGEKSRQYTFTEILTTRPVYTLFDVPEGVTFFAAVTAYDKEGHESDYSNEVEFEIPVTTTTIVTTSTTITTTTTTTTIDIPPDPPKFLKFNVKVLVPLEEIKSELTKILKE